MITRMKFPTIVNSRGLPLNIGLLLIAASSLFGVASAPAQHGHLNAGSVSQTPGAALQWVNGALFASNSGYVQTMTFSTNGTHTGYFNSGPTVTALPTTAANGSAGPSPFASLPGSFVSYRLSLLSAPGGGKFGYWESSSNAPTYHLSVGEQTPLIALSDATLGAGTPGGDPYGHIHGRRFSGTVVGNYVVGLQAFDTSTNPTPHTPSDVLYVAFNARPNRQNTAGHLNAGAQGTNQNDQLLWANGALFAANSGYYYPMNLATNGTYAGYYNSAPTLTALAGTTAPAGLPPAMGSFLRAQITLVSGPEGGKFAFWTNTAGPAFNLGVGESSALFDLSDRSAGAGTPGGDPFGHLHGRRFTATARGDYIVDFRLFDTSTNGLAGGPIHTPSDAFLMDFRTMPIRPILAAPTRLTNRVSMWLAGETNQNYTVQVTTNFTNWTTFLATNSPSANPFMVSDPNATNAQQFYRVLIGP